MAGRTAHRVLDRYLLDGERVVAEIRYHRIVLLKPLALLLVVTALVVWIDISTGASADTIVRIGWAAWLATLAWAAWQWLQWRHTRVVATDKRIVLFEGWINHKVAMMPLKKVTDMGYERSLLGRVVGYGTFILESAGQDQRLSRIDFVPDPDHNYRTIIAEIFGVADRERTPPEAGWDAPAVDVGPPTPMTPTASATPHSPVEDHYAPPPSIYRSADLERRGRDARDDDTGELPPYRGENW